MSFKKLLDQKALQAFNMLKDLADTATFENTTVTGFDFDTGNVEKTEAEPTVIKMVVVETKKKDSTITKVVLARLTDTGILDEFDSLTLNGVIWKIGPILSETGQVVSFEIYREGSDG
jgi:hypothetical protein